MDEIEHNDVDIVSEEADELDTVPESEAVEENPTKEAPADKPTETPEQKVARLQRQLERAKRDLGQVDEKPQSEAKSGLDDRDLDYLDLKGVTHEEDIELIENVMKKTGMSARETLKDEYIAARLKANSDRRAVKSATPSSNRRHADTGDMLARDLSKFESSGEVPQDFERRTALFDALEKKTNPNRPDWHR